MALLDNEKSTGTLESRWGKGFNEEDYAFLEKEFKEWKNDRPAESKSQDVVLKEICHKQLEISKLRANGNPVDGYVKELINLLKML